MKQIAAAHQPNFFPWLGWFDKFHQADIFIVLDDVQFPRCGSGNWGNRVKIQLNGKEKWLTASVDRTGASLIPFNKILFSEKVPWRKSALARLEAAYNKAPFYIETMDFIAPLLLNSQNSLVDYNMNALLALINLAGLDEKKIKMSSSFQIQSTGSARLAELVKEVGAAIYLYGGGCSGYQDENDFLALALETRPQNFVSPIYSQFHQKQGVFLPGLSVLDYLFCAGPDKLKTLFANR